MICFNQFDKLGQCFTLHTFIIHHFRFCPLSRPMSPGIFHSCPPRHKRIAVREANCRDGAFFGLRGWRCGMGVAALAAVFGLWTAALARFLVPNVTGEPDQTFKAGFPGEYPPGKVETKFKDRYQTWIVSFAHDGRRKIIALRAVCTHLGCITLWNESENRFKCPCHGSGFSVGRHQPRRPRPAAVGSLRHPTGRRRPVGNRSRESV